MVIGTRLGEAVKRSREIFTRRPSAGLVTAQATAGLTAEGAQTIVRMGAHSLVADAPVAHGGDAAGPTPGDLIRGALAACLAMNYAMHAPRFDVKLYKVDVTVETEIDLGPSVGVPSEQQPGFSAVRHTATLTTDAPEESVRELVAFAERFSPSLDDVRRGLPVEGQLVICRPADSQ